MEEEEPYLAQVGHMVRYDWPNRELNHLSSVTILLALGSYDPKKQGCNVSRRIHAPSAFCYSQYMLKIYHFAVTLIFFFISEQYNWKGNALWTPQVESALTLSIHHYLIEF